MSELTVAERITKGKIWLMSKRPWFGQLSTYLNEIPVDKIPTAAIDARGNLYYNEKFMGGLKDEEIRAVLCHEVLHIALRHLERQDFRHPELFNIAADLKVNIELRDQNDLRLPDKSLMPDSNNEWKAFGITVKEINEKTSEQIYHEIKKKLEDKAPKGYQGDLIMIGGEGMSDDQKKALQDAGYTEVSAGEATKLARDWQGRVHSAATTCKGDVPGGVAREIFKLENSELPWTQILHDRMRRLGVKHSWKKPSTRYMPWYFPGRCKNHGIKVMAVMDTSGSMSQEQITKGLSELFGLTRAFPFLELWISDCDAKVYEAKKVKPADISRLLLSGGGGTDFRPAFDWVHKNLVDDIDCLLFFTDLYGDFPTRKPPYEVFWITDTTSQQVPFGRKLLLKSEE
jgi:predicted metal-dependent peptidase